MFIKVQKLDMDASEFIDMIINTTAIAAIHPVSFGEFDVITVDADSGVRLLREEITMITFKDSGHQRIIVRGTIKEIYNTLTTHH